MKHSRHSLGSLVIVLTFGLAALPAVAEGLVPGHAKKASAPRNSLYIVRMADSPAVAYDGGIPGLRATRPGANRKIDPQSPDVVRYTGYLESRHDEAVSRAGGRKVYSYKYAFNGFAAELSPGQAEALKALPGVLSIEKDEARALDTSSTPSFLGLNAPGGLWSHGAAGVGEGIIVGIVDGGIWPEHPSFSDRTGANGNGTQDGKLDYQQLPGWHGRCVPGDFFDASHCNQKVIGARYYNAGWGGNAGVNATLPWEYNSPRDFGGHGTHTASTSAGNAGVMPDGSASVFGPISGIAPRARIAVYKVCFQTPDGGSCFQSDSVAAIDQAVADGVDVINFSVGGSRTNFRDAVEIAFMFAADAGVFVATSAGNSGPGNFTVAHGGPWLTTVSAGTHNRSGTGSITTGDGVTYNGRSIALPVTAPVIDATAAGLPDADPEKVRLCYSKSDNEGVAVLDPARIAGKIVLCDRGVTGRVLKSLAVQEGGGAGMVLFNTAAGLSVDADYHFVPTVHLDVPARAPVKAYAAGASPTASIAQGTVVLDLAAPIMASFSSRGPLQASGDILKPDVMAPGQDILAAVAPPGNGGRLFELYNGTSMSSPHVAGLGAILKGLHPDWSPMMIKSAIMTTGIDSRNASGTPANPNSVLTIFNQGAGHIQPNAANDPGLVFDAGFADWLGFLCGTQLPTSFCTSSGIAVLDPSDYNGASVAIGDLAGVQVVKRRVTNVGPRATYAFSHTGLAGFAVTPSPPTFTLGAGESQDVTLRFERTTAALGGFHGGQLAWSDGAHRVRIPAVIVPVALAAPAQVSGTNAAVSYGVKFGFAGPFTAAPRGLLPASLATGSVKGSNGADFDPEATDGTVTAFTVEVPAGTTYARFSLFDASAEAGSDLDIYVYLGTTLVALSGTPTSTEEANLANPAAGTYTVYVHGFDAATPTAGFTLFSWLLGSANAGNMTVAVAPSTATTGGAGTVTVTPGALTAGVKYLGSVAYGAPANTTAPTIVRFDP
jgi:hypothetical protein